MASLQAYQSHGHRYYRIVESFRQDGKPRLRVVAHLGRVEDILRLTQDERADIKVSSVTSGAVTALHHLAQELDIAGKIDHALEAALAACGAWNRQPARALSDKHTTLLPSNTLYAKPSPSVRITLPAP